MEQQQQYQNLDRHLHCPTTIGISHASETHEEEHFSYEALTNMYEWVIAIYRTSASLERIVRDFRRGPIGLIPVNFTVRPRTRQDPWAFWQAFRTADHNPEWRWN